MRPLQILDNSICPSTYCPLAHMASDIQSREWRSMFAIRVKSDAIEKSAARRKEECDLPNPAPPRRTVLMLLLLTLHFRTLRS